MNYREIYLTAFGDQPIDDPNYLRFLKLAKHLEERLIDLRHLAFVNPDRTLYPHHRAEKEEYIRQVGGMIGEEYGAAGIIVCEEAIRKSREAIPSPDSLATVATLVDRWEYDGG